MIERWITSLIHNWYRYRKSFTSDCTSW